MEQRFLALESPLEIPEWKADFERVNCTLPAQIGVLSCCASTLSARRIARVKNPHLRVFEIPK
jgi:hypothetical protein